MRLFDVIRSSAYDPAFYGGMRERSITEAAKYYAAIAFVIVFAYLVPVWALVLTLSPSLVDRITAAYPDNLEISYANGEIHTNQVEPYSVPNPFLEGKPKHLAVFDTYKDDYDPASLDSSDTFLLFKRTFLVAPNTERGGAGEQRIFSYGTSTGTSTLTKTQVLGVAEEIKKYIRPAALIGGAFVFVIAVLMGGILMLGFHLLYVLLPALLVYLALRFTGRPEEYGTAYVMTLYASIPVAIISALAVFAGGLPPYVYTLLVLTIVGANILRVPQTDTR